MNIKKLLSLLLISLTFLLMLLSCRNEPPTIVSPINPPNKININIYLENSMSMNGFLYDNNTEFRTAFRDLIVDLEKKYGKNKINYFLINDSIYPFKVSTDFASDINSISINKGNIKSSNINNIFNQIIDKTYKNTISILVSDMIYDTDEGTLEQNRSITEKYFDKAMKNGLTTLFVKYYSSFKGSLYNPKLNNTKKVISPNYYYCILGKEDEMKSFSETIKDKWESYKGYIDRILYSKSEENNINALVHNELIKDAQTNKDNNTIENASQGTEFLILCDLSNFKGIQRNYICNPKNYETSDSSYSIAEIIKIENLKIKFNGREKTIESTKYEKCTHCFKIKIQQKQFSDINLKLRFKQPQWDSHNDPNANHIIQDTYGIKELLEGVMDGYELDNNKKYFTINISKN